MRFFFALILAGALSLAAGCAGSPEADWSDLPAAESQTPWQYPIAAGVWYPGDGPLPEHAFKYYRVRCWPGCHDPNSAPQPHP